MTETGSRSGGWRTKLWGVLIAILVGAALFGVGWWEGRQGVGAVKDQLAATEAQLAHARDRAAVAQAEAALYRAAADLDLRNFGTANAHLQEAGRELGAVSYTGAPGLASLRSAITSTDITTATNLESQRAEVLGMAARLDSVVAADSVLSGGPGQ